MIEKKSICNMIQVQAHVCWYVITIENVEFLARKMGGGHKIFDDQNVGSHKMTTDSELILLKRLI